jgi:hypothetical protein
MKNWLLSISVVIAISGCRSSPTNIIDDVFLAIADTSTYRYYQFFPPPQSPMMPVKDKGRYLVCMNEQIDDTNKYLEGLMVTRIIQKFPDYKRLIHPGNTRRSESIDISQLETTGLFSIKPGKECSINHPDYVGYIQLHTILRDNTHGIMVYEKGYSQKSGVVIVLLLEKASGRWQPVAEEELLRW